MKAIVIAPMAGVLAFALAPTAPYAASMPQIVDGSTIHLVQGRGGGDRGGGGGPGFSGGGGGPGGAGGGAPQMGGGGPGGGGPGIDGGGPRGFGGGGGPGMGGGPRMGGEGGPRFRDGGPRMGGEIGPRLREGGPRMGGEIGPRLREGGPRIGREFERGPRRGFGGGREGVLRFDRDRDFKDRDFKDRDRRRFVVRKGRHFFWRPGYFWSGVWIAPGYYYAQCEWLRRQAYLTDSPSWWRRYYRCVDEYY